jgi:Flp pilus assembly protein TadG
MRALIRFGKRFARDASGVSAIEFAVAAPAVLILILGTIELALDMVVDASVQIAAQQASRVGLTTVAPASGTRTQQAQNIAMQILKPWSALGTISISEQSYASYSDHSAGNGTQNSMGGYGDIVSYNISVTMPTFSGIPKLLGVEQMTFERNFIVQNEK